MSRGKFTLEQKLQILAWIDGGHGITDAAAKFHVNDATTIRRWRIKLEAGGTAAISRQSKNKHYRLNSKLRRLNHTWRAKAL